MAIGEALALAEAEGYVRVFVDEGAPMAGLLRDVGKDIVSPAYLDRLSRAFAGSFAPVVAVRAGESAHDTGSASHSTRLAEPLSPREREVLRLIAAGCSNDEIARTFVVAISTVKTHVNNVFGKLGVWSRTQAVARARDLNLL